METISLYHGAQRWQGPPELKPAGKGRSEMGSGLYLTTSYETAKKYAKGGGTVLLFTLDADLSFINNTKLPLDVCLAFLRSMPRLKSREAIIDDLKVAAKRMGGDPFAYQLENLLINYDSLKGDKGPMLAQFFVNQGVDAGLVKHSNEDWVVLYNLEKIVSYKKVTPSDVLEWHRERLTLR